MTGNGRISAKQRLFVAALLTSKTVADAAREAGVSERTGRRYLSDERVKHALSEALDAALGEVTRNVIAAMTSALNTLENVHTDTRAPASARVASARAVLGVALQLREHTDLSERLSRLEEVTR